MISLSGQTFWLYRGGCEIAVANDRHAIWSHTCITFDAPPTSYAELLSDLTPLPALLVSPLELAGGPWPYTNWLFERMWPLPRWCHTRSVSYGTPSYRWNSVAPEAAFRLQRVGVHNGRRVLGRIMLPILDDSWFTDPPHCRRVDGALWTSRIGGNTLKLYKSWTHSGRTYQLCIFHRREWAYTPVTDYVVSSSVGRVWQRNRTYEPWHHHNDDMTFTPDELDA